MLRAPRVGLILLFLQLFTQLKSQETIIKVPFSQPKKLVVDAGDNLVISEGQTITVGTDVNITGGSPEYLYNWKDDKNNEYSTLTFSVNETGKFYLTVTDENHCTEVDSVFVSLPTLLEENETDARLTLFPNPSSGLFYFRIKAPGINVKIEVVTTEGRVVFKKEYESLNQDFTGMVDLTGFDKGVYYVKLIRTDSSLIKSIIIQ